MYKYFITSVAPNGFTVNKKGAHLLKLSVCLDLDIEKLSETDAEAAQANHADYKTRFAAFYHDFDDIAHLFQPSALVFNAGPNEQVIPISSANTIPVPAELQKLRQQLWSKIFAKEKTTTKGKVNREVEILSVITRGMKFAGKFQSISQHLSYLYKGKDDDINLSGFFKKAQKASGAHKTVSRNKRMKFDMDVHIKLGDRSHLPSDFSGIKGAANFVHARELNLADYLDAYIDPDEFINSFNLINKNVILKRLLGFIIDLEIDVSGIVPPGPGMTDFKVAARFPLPDKFVSLTSLCYRNTIGNKSAYLLEQKGAYHVTTLLRARNAATEYVELITYDRIAQDDKLKDYYINKRHLESARQDSFTRGILFIHHELSQLIEAEEYPRDDTTRDIIEATPVNDRLFIHGYRVAVTRADTGKYGSLTSRSAKIFTNDPDHPLYQAEVNEGCVQSDAVMHAMEQDGKVNGYTSDTLFEWSGQSLSLKSAFSRASKLSALDKAYYDLKNPDDNGVEKSKIATEQHLQVAYYPAPVTDQTPQKVKVYYGMPGKAGGLKGNKLRFGHSYQFVVSAEYKNGWGLPLDKDPANAFQLTVNDLIARPDYRDCISSSVSFSPLENRQPPLIFPKRKIETEDYSRPGTDQAKLIPITDKESLKHLVIRSETPGDRFQYVAERHVLPERISLEHSFWHDLLNKMSDNEALDWKYRYNCPFHTQDDYNTFVQAKDQNGVLKGHTCPESCHRYCGGTKMADYFPQPSITPTYLADPLIRGASIRLFWNEQCTADMEIAIGAKEMHFGGTPGTGPRSFMIKAAGSLQEPNTTVTPLFDIFNFWLKKGINIYAQLTNILTDDGIKYAQTKWYDTGHQSFRSVHKIAKKGILGNDGPHNPPLTLQLTHAVKTPLFNPGIDGFFTSPSRAARVKHLAVLLAADAYKYYKVGLNIIAERAADLDHNYLPGGTFARIAFISKFERLDATSVGKPFLPGVNPTGALEIWMRNEEYIDDPQQHVLDRPAGPATWDHNPEHPVEPFSSDRNHFSQEHKIAFDNDIMAQLKDRKNATFDLHEANLFLAVTTQLMLGYDIKTTKFEEREYYLRDISKFNGYFIETASAESPGDSERYALPKREEVERDSAMRFKVLVLNNRTPQKPEIAFAVTTKKETITRGQHNYYNYRQEGNIVTIYLKRGRLTSGKDERVGLPVSFPKSDYNRLFTELNMISRAGRDVVSDGFSNPNVLLDATNILIPPEGENEYDARFDPLLGMFHYLPKFCVERQLWKFEVVFNIKTKDTQHQMHNPFINIALVHYQPFSVNYNSKGPDSILADLDMDCRLSRPDRGAWCYLLPERNLNVYFAKPFGVFTKGSVKLTANFDYESLHHYQHQKDGIIRTNFIVAVEGSSDNLYWEPVMSLNAHNEIKLIHPLMPEMVPADGIAEVSVELTFEREAYTATRNDGTKQKYYFQNFRIRFSEVEWFTEKTWKAMNVDEQQDFLDNKQLRVRYVEIMY